MAHKDKSNNGERRRFFRIDDDINLYYKIISGDGLIGPSHLSKDILNSCSLSTALDLMTQEAKLALYRIEQNEPEIAKYLAIMNNKIDLLAQALIAGGADSDSAEDQTRNVNLSASGVAFNCNEMFKVGDLLEIRMMLSSLPEVIVTCAKVVYCKENTGHDAGSHGYQVGVDYVNLQEHEQELINKHIIKKQMQQLRAKND